MQLLEDFAEIVKGALLIFIARRFSRDRPRFTDTLDVIKFVCKDLWILVFRKQIDNLKTNHRVRFPILSCEQRHPKLRLGAGRICLDG